MKSLTLAACLLVACSLTAAAGRAESPWTYSPRTIACSFSELHVEMGTAQGGVIVVSASGRALISTNAAHGIVKPIDSHCKRIVIKTLPKPLLPRPSYPMNLGSSSDCTSRGPVLIHAHFLRTAGRPSGLYVSVRERRTGRFIIAGLITARQPAREYIGSTCVGR
jgi:hypothetical protein